VHSGVEEELEFRGVAQPEALLLELPVADEPELPHDVQVAGDELRFDPWEPTDAVVSELSL